jgi:hypothetical protein
MREREFATGVLRQLSSYIDAQNDDVYRHPFLVSHAWTDGPMMHLVYTAPPSDVSWGLVRDTRESTIGTGPWQDSDEAVRYYYLLDFEEHWPGRCSRKPAEPQIIRWRGHHHPGLPEFPADIPDEYRVVPSSTRTSPAIPRPSVGEPRRYRDP